MTIFNPGFTSLKKLFSEVPYFSYVENYQYWLLGVSGKNIPQTIFDMRSIPNGGYITSASDQVIKQLTFGKEYSNSLFASDGNGLGILCAVSSSNNGGYTPGVNLTLQYINQ